MNRADYAKELKLTQKELDAATDLWNTMSREERDPFVDNVPFKIVKTRNSSIIFVYIANELKKAGKI